MHTERERLCRPDVRKASDFPIRQINRRGLASIIAAAILTGLLALATTAQAQRKPAGAAIPSPSSVFGFTPGDDRTVADWKQITDYFARLDKASDRVSVQTIGQSTLGRPLIAAFISAPENIRNLEKYKDVQRRLADPRQVSGEAERIN